MVTKEECLEALETLTSRGGNAGELMYWTFAMCGEVKILMDLINEHFDNPPLEWEELKQGMWIWDNVSKEWMKVEITRETYTKFIECWTIGWHLLKKIEYKDNRFYRKEVQE